MKIVRGKITSVSSKTSLIYAADGVGEHTYTFTALPANLYVGACFLMDWDTKTILQEASAEVVQELTASGAVTAGVESVELNHASTVVAATIADASKHPGIFHLKDTSASGTAAHTCTITTGTWDGTNKVATLNAPKECLIVYFDKSGNGTILENVGSVALS